jgi:hypothetical protein
LRVLAKKMTISPEQLVLTDCKYQVVEGIYLPAD